MAEYIDRDRLKEVFNRNVVSADVFNDIIDGQPTADVIERTKIDKAIEEISRLQTYVCHVGDTKKVELEDVLDILKSI